jgi:predicted RNA binding protein YcfA (HicA-like mRNA interferase family)
VARLANISGKEAVKAFEKAGWRIVGQVGSHILTTKAVKCGQTFLFPSTTSCRWGR